MLRDTIGANDDQGLELFNSETKTYSKYNEKKPQCNVELACTTTVHRQYKVIYIDLSPTKSLVGW